MSLSDVNPDFVYIGDTPGRYMSAVIGYTYDTRHLVYSYTRLIEAFMAEGMTEEEAIEWYDYNTERSLPYAGEFRPFVVMDSEDALEDLTYGESEEPGSLPALPALQSATDGDACPDSRNGAGDHVSKDDTEAVVVDVVDEGCGHGEGV